MNLIPFQFSASVIRVVEDAGEVFFAARDVAQVLGYVDSTNAIKQHCRGVAKHHPIVDSLGRHQEARFLSQADVLRLIVRSRLPAAERFERWVFEDVLPTIARTGRYGQPSAIAALRDPATLLALLGDYAKDKQALQHTVADQATALSVQAPKVRALDRLSETKATWCLRETAKMLKMRPSDLIRWMQEHSWIYRDHGTWQAYRPRIKSGLLTYTVGFVSDAPDARPWGQTRVTGKGLARLAELLERELGDDVAAA